MKVVYKAAFRKDINGLRAIAVVAVILYHFGVTGWAGGFVGVDVFFVISGYLMTEIITSRINNKTFSIYGFYLARAQRIIPALAALCGTLLISGWFFLPSSELQELGSQVKSSLLFISNQKFMADAGYFDSSSQEKWLLHSWSLSVEWQFYLIFPLYILAISKITKTQKHLVYFVALIVVTSYAAAHLAAKNHSAFNFFSFATRAWEMGIGGVVYLLPKKLNDRCHSTILGLAGFSAIIASIFLMSEGGDWPGPTTLLPVLGCAIVIYANANSRLLSNSIAQWLGKISYSLYLWHWPIVVALVYLQLHDSLMGITAGICATLLLGALSHAAFEQAPQSFLKHTTFARSSIALAILVVSVVGISHVVYKSSINRPEQRTVAIAEKEASNQNPRRKTCLIFKGVESPGCIYGGEGRLAAIVLGDSHANASVNAVTAALPDKDLNVQEWSYASCPTITGLNLVKNDRQCREFNEWAIQKLTTIDSSVPVIIINRSSSYPMGNEDNLTASKGKPIIYFSKPYSSPEPEFLREYTEHYVSTICQISKRHKVYIVRPYPEMLFNVPKQLARDLMIQKDAEISITLAAYKSRHAFVYSAQDLAAKECGVTILDPLPYLCDENKCKGSQDGRPYYYDGSHLSEFGNRRLIPMFQPVFRLNHS
jgi:peptidoglycan/LPS O-acetylase OafA/YrhL